MSRRAAEVCACLTAAVLAGCAGGTPSARALPLAGRAAPLTSPIGHVVIVIQENRSVDNLFQFLPGANTAAVGFDSKGLAVQLQPESLTAPYDMDHTHDPSWVTEYNHGGMNGFDLAACIPNSGHKCPTDPAYAYVPQSEVQAYYAMAENYTFADNTFQSNQGPSFPAHQYLLSGTSTVADGSLLRAAENPLTSKGTSTGGCESPPGSLVNLIDPQGRDGGAGRVAFPCFVRRSLISDLDEAGLSWAYYRANGGAGIWNGVDALRPIWKNQTEYNADVIYPSSRFLTDVGNHKLAAVTWITPTALASDHPAINNGSGPSWVASVVNAIGESPFVNSTVIFVIWDDWGGLYDHVKPPIYNSYELGFRVPLVVISPYAKRGYVSHVRHEFGSILKFTEEVFGLPSLGTTDERSDDLSDCFDFNAPPRRFRPIPAKYSATYFLHRPISNESPDDDR